MSIPASRLLLVCSLAAGSTMAVGGPELDCSGINMKSRLAGLAASGWRYDLASLTQPGNELRNTKILGFDADGKPVLPNTSHFADPEAIRHERLGWDKISQKSAKIVSFIGTLTA